MNRMAALLVGSARPWRPASAFVIEHPRAGLVVFDCGLSDAVARDGEAALGIPMRWLFESRGHPGRTLDAQMREAGLDPGRVRLVVLSHWHDDHLGAAPAFPGATFIGGPGTAGYAIAPGFAPSRRTLDFAGAAALPPFDAAVDLLGDGSLWVLRGGGHTREDLLVLLPLPDGPVLLAGDAVVHRDWLAADDVQRIAVDPMRAADVRNRIRALAAAVPGLVLVPGHDLGGVPHDRADVVWHHPELVDPAAWPIDAGASSTNAPAS
jgi:glyoxylase-like metal-dependent hydrolase (beta-lactamase superfamily II)